MSESEPKKRRLKIGTGAVRVAVLVPAEGTVADACAAAEKSLSGRLGKRRIRTFALPDGCELVAGDRIADAVQDGEELRPVFEEAGAEGRPDEMQWAGQGEHGQGAAAVSGSPEGGVRDEGKEGDSAENDGRGVADEQESGREMSGSDDDKPLGVRKTEVKAEKKAGQGEGKAEVELRLRMFTIPHEKRTIVRVRPEVV
jgi:hypothetical protein